MMLHKGFTPLQTIGRQKKSKMSITGFTLLETLFVTFIMTVLMAILITGLIQSRIIFQATDISATLQANSRQAMNKMALDLIRAKRSPAHFTIFTDDPAGSGSDRITYELPQYDADGNPILTGWNINWDPNVVTINLDPLTGALMRTQGAASTVLANNVRRVIFFDHSRDPTLYLDELRMVLEVITVDINGRVYNQVCTSILKMRN